MLRAAIFDLDDTLIPESAPWREALAAVCGPVEEDHGVPPGFLAQAVEAIASARYEILDFGHDFSARFGVSWEECLWGPLAEASARQLPGLGAVAAALRKTTWADALETVGIRVPGLAAELDRRYERDRRGRHHPFPTAAATVAALRDRGLLVACVTNGASEIQREKLRRSGVEPWFDVVLVSGEEGVGKPDPEILRLACDRLGVTADEAIYVGNSPVRDIACAEAAGMRSVLVWRDEEAPAKPDERASSRDMTPNAVSRGAGDREGSEEGADSRSVLESSRLPGPRAIERVVYDVHGLIGYVDGWRAARTFRAVDAGRRPVSIDLLEPREGGFTARVGPERDPLRPKVAGTSALRVIEAGLRALRARAGDEPWRHELGEPVDWDALLR